MSELLVVAFDQEGTADQVRDRLENLSEGRVSRSRRHGHSRAPRKRQSQNQPGQEPSRGRGGERQFWGPPISLLFLAPWLGLAIGAASSAFAGHLTEVGIDDDFNKQVAESIPTGALVIFMLAGCHANPEACAGGA